MHNQFYTYNTNRFLSLLLEAGMLSYPVLRHCEKQSNEAIPLYYNAFRRLLYFVYNDEKRANTNNLTILPLREVGGAPYA